MKHSIKTQDTEACWYSQSNPAQSSDIIDTSQAEQHSAAAATQEPQTLTAHISIMLAVPSCLTDASSWGTISRRLSPTSGLSSIHGHLMAGSFRVWRWCELSFCQRHVWKTDWSKRNYSLNLLDLMSTWSMMLTLCFLLISRSAQRLNINLENEPIYNFSFPAVVRLVCK